MTDEAPKVPMLRSGGAVNAIVPQSLEDVYRMAKAVVMAGMAPKSVNTPERAMVAIMHGLEVGLTPMAALQSIAVVNGMPTIWGDGALALVRASGLCEYVKEWEEGEGDVFVGWCEVKRAGEEEPIRRYFSVKDAREAGLLSKDGPWKQYRRRMCQMRARAWAMRDGFADVLKGMRVREEVDDYQDVTTGADGATQLSRPAQILAARLSAPAATLDEALDAADAIKAEVEEVDETVPQARGTAAAPAAEPGSEGEAATPASEPTAVTEAGSQPSGAVSTEKMPEQEPDGSGKPADGQEPFDAVKNAVTGDEPPEDVPAAAGGGFADYADGLAASNDAPQILNAFKILRASEPWKAAEAAQRSRAWACAYLRLRELNEAGYAYDFLNDLHLYRGYLEIETDKEALRGNRDAMGRSTLFTDLDTPAKKAFDRAYDDALARINAGGEFT